MIREETPVAAASNSNTKKALRDPLQRWAMKESQFPTIAKSNHVSREKLRELVYLHK